MFDKKGLKKIMDAYHDYNKDLAAYLGMSVPNFSTIWNGRQQFNVNHIRRIAVRYSLDPQQVWDIFLFPESCHPLSGWHVLPLEGDITCLRPEGALKSANCTTFTAAPKLGAFSVLPYSGVASKEACWFALTSYFRSKRDLLIVFLHRLTRERVDILY